MMRLFLPWVVVILILDATTNLARATSIVIHIGKGEILIGADSRNVKKGYDSQ
jgi:hypothetical protein